MRKDFYAEYEAEYEYRMQSQERFWNMIALAGSLGVAIAMVVSFLGAVH